MLSATPFALMAAAAAFILSLLVGAAGQDRATRLSLTRVLACIPSGLALLFVVLPFVETEHLDLAKFEFATRLCAGAAAGCWIAYAWYRTR